MSNSADNWNKMSIDFFVSSNSEASGNLNVRRDVLLEGIFFGNIKCRNIEVAQNAAIFGSLCCENAIVCGKITDDLYVKNMLLIDGNAEIPSNSEFGEVVNSASYVKKLVAKLRNLTDGYVQNARAATA